MLRRLAEPPFVEQPGHAAQIEALQQTLAELQAQQTPRALREARLLYRQASQAAPQDFYLLADFAKLEEDSADFPEAARLWTAVRDLLPFAPGPHYYLGRVLARTDQTREALQEFSRALAIQPDLPDALEEKARLLTSIGQFDEALALLKRAGDLQPANARLCLDLADTLAQAAAGPRP